MNRYSKLLNWEVVRFSKIFGVLGLLIIVAQFFGIWLNARAYLSSAEITMERKSLTAIQYGEQFTPAKMTDSLQSIWFEGSIALCAVTIFIYIFWTWYKEWLGKNTFAYRLLMLPTSRMNVYLAKLTAIVLYVWGFVALQFVLLPVQLALFNSLIPNEWRQPITIAELIGRNRFIHMLLPSDFIEFVLYYGAGVMSVVILFTGILLERSYRLKGIVAGFLYSAAAVVVLILPYLVENKWPTDTWFPSEVLLYQAVIGLCLTAVSLWLSSYLLRKKVTV
ncbi:hypothetical protein BC351_17865 [Paenibacillus ferrarius]|uniref:Uncharacterized protein n=1 Tax=Paenibacillus ferrarius TaxID=1469647 RepID=A0A1V4HQ81_9BACL|nr:hypothetical protein [Paenibacillus ferrarius]OPH60364.1 hypothetical protein BC351_17865 [Paenibacillus ferrarius]